ncbi:hypothetical protein C0Q70_13720 [Pomacea canaliculata]|uniref:Uncharacterized protein n=1 Tax=Pomacea canaliculata TaxID=400727 RepID=A0A2T7NY10_POMCA|nr:hypothetical protein C0Q70_13720 [Pomacea canaliculata]
MMDLEFFALPDFSKRYAGCGKEDVNGRQTTIFLVWKQSPKFVPLRNRTGSPCISKPGPPVLAIPSSSGTIQRGREREGSHVGWGQEGEAVAAPHAGWDTAPCSGGNGPPRPTRMLWLVRCRITRPTRLGGASPRSPVQFSVHTRDLNAHVQRTYSDDPSKPRGIRKLRHPIADER